MSIGQDLTAGLKAFHVVSSDYEAYPFKTFKEFSDFVGPLRRKDMLDTLALGDGILDRSAILDIFSDYADELEGVMPPFGRKNHFNEMIVDATLDPPGFSLFRSIARGTLSDTVDKIEDIGEASAEIANDFGSSIAVTAKVTALLLPVAVVGLGYVYWKSFAARAG